MVDRLAEADPRVQRDPGARDTGGLGRVDERIRQAPERARGPGDRGRTGEPDRVEALRAVAVVALHYAVRVDDERPVLAEVDLGGRPRRVIEDTEQGPSAVGWYLEDVVVADDQWTRVSGQPHPEEPCSRVELEVAHRGEGLVGLPLRAEDAFHAVERPLGIGTGEDEGTPRHS